MTDYQDRLRIRIMTERELLEDCLEAFRAIPTAKTAKKLLKKRGQDAHTPYSGSAPYRLAKIMELTISNYLSETAR